MRHIILIFTLFILLFSCAKRIEPTPSAPACYILSISDSTGKPLYYFRGVDSYSADSFFVKNGAKIIEDARSEGSWQWFSDSLKVGFILKNISDKDDPNSIRYENTYYKDGQIKSQEISIYSDGTWGDKWYKLLKNGKLETTDSIVSPFWGRYVRYKFTDSGVDSVIYDYEFESHDNGAYKDILSKVYKVTSGDKRNLVMEMTYDHSLKVSNLFSYGYTLMLLEQAGIQSFFNTDLMHIKDYHQFKFFTDLKTYYDDGTLKFSSQKYNLKLNKAGYLQSYTSKETTYGSGNPQTVYRSINIDYECY